MSLIFAFYTHLFWAKLELFSLSSIIICQQTCARKLLSRTEHIKLGLCLFRLHHGTWETYQLYKRMLKRVSIFGCVNRTKRTVWSKSDVRDTNFFGCPAKADTRLKNKISTDANFNVLCETRHLYKFIQVCQENVVSHTTLHTLLLILQKTS